MLRKFLLGTGALALVLGLATGSGGGLAGATKTPAQMTGPITCSAAGLVKFSPKLTNGGSTSGVVTLRVKLKSCTGTGTVLGGVTLTGGSLLATTSAPVASNCGPILSGSTFPTFSGTIKWKGSGGPVASSTVTVDGAALFYNSGLDTLTTYLTTVAIGSGSYGGENMHYGHLMAAKDALKTTSTCAAGGIGSVKFGAVGGTVSVGA
jgi:hypothetical protein